MSESVHIVVMGVAGSGKTTVARILAERLDRPYAEADEFHPPENIAKMSSGAALTDEDRWPWLRAIRDWLTERSRAGESAVVTCSALKVAYRDLLREAEGRVRFLHLQAPAPLLEERMEHRTGHFMPTSLLASQLDTLEPLTDAEDGVTISVETPPEDVADRAVAALHLTPTKEHS
ncbi:gluconokinase [Cellulomonas edaphi]|uniref:Gluconokinase n=1 Tax=Cellulomonas edaphi TaxID=3053468 RepID=A0ABT7S618_9CELL|nr:gluconokinase [Cellulomons edaphi]MDM7831062.1 gluconokinase [Cellulomons edaphi]